MRKDGGAPHPPALNPIGKLVLCFETKLFLAVLLSLTLVAVVWNLQPFYENNFLSANTTAAASCSSSVPASAVESLPVRTAAGNATHLAEKKFVRSGSLPPDGDPNRRTFQAHGSAAALFVQMGAYRGGPRTFSVVGLASKPTHVFGL